MTERSVRGLAIVGTISAAATTAASIAPQQAGVVQAGVVQVMAGGIARVASLDEPAFPCGRGHLCMRKELEGPEDERDSTKSNTPLLLSGWSVATLNRPGLFIKPESLNVVSSNSAPDRSQKPLVYQGEGLRRSGGLPPPCASTAPR
ncbi:hypothetical protein [Actinomadura madurae]|uniref:hypothetical protein n=1 Tax=Actinomadura madurae TaxID=1993 RepID=UPI002026365D|nr:hypothetical protein [Actinomadura madurae]MCP9953562.1 hypothetical protein [Actinomadura madurae]MCP9970319.1 hypothetical protein [Actinomadura madurae]MCP9982796.1 hypothetical protein [Actinomadura madurae]MCQ0005655.1 hypothetical protein [Actinomadura madurae]MCQ0019031.1 hypothetical protein [Actinomadura madurae]